ncbi:MAG: TrkA family potassium uptake protein [Solobacterium sp.]|nr:TrkA family potassium uptake protein [Solobacterium sp.]
MKNVLIIGAGRFGRYTAIKMKELGHQIMAVDKNEDRVNKILPYVTDAQIGDSTDGTFLRTLGITDFDLCVVAIGDDFLSSLETTSLLEELGAKKIIARATSGNQEKFLMKNGATAVVFPERQLGFWTAIRYGSDSISNYIELSGGFSIYEVAVPREWNGKKVGELDVRRRYQINILGVQNGTMNMDVNIDTVLHSGDRLLVLGKNETLQKLFID